MGGSSRYEVALEEEAGRVVQSDRENSFLFLGMTLRRGKTGCCSQSESVPG